MVDYLQTFSCQYMIIGLEDDAEKQIHNYLEALSCFELVGVGKSVTDALDILKVYPNTSLVFAGINDEHQTGLGISHFFRDVFDFIILFSGEGKYALTAFQANCDHFMLLPIEESTFHSALASFFTKHFRQ